MFRHKRLIVMQWMRASKWYDSIEQEIAFISEMSLELEHFYQR